MEISDHKRLLILDDEPLVAKLLGVAAERAGFEVKTTSAYEQMNCLLRDWSPSHLAIDLVLPGKSGPEILQELADASCQAAIILTSGLGAEVLESVKRSAAQRGLHILGLLPKPFTMVELRSLLESDIV